MRILVALDGSKFAEAIIQPVAQLAVAADAEVFLVQAAQPSRIHSTWMGSPEEYVEAARAAFTPGGMRVGKVSPGVAAPRQVESENQALGRVVQAGRDYLSQIAHRFAPIEPEVTVLVGNDVDEVLASFAREQQIDLIAISSHGRTGLARQFMGNHASKLLRYRVAPLMIVKPDGRHQIEDHETDDTRAPTLSTKQTGLSSMPVPTP